MSNELKKCEDCKHYNKETNFVGECFKINMSVMIQNEIPEAEDFSNANKLMVRKEFGCVLFESK
jgi:hypothetical protein